MFKQRDLYPNMGFGANTTEQGIPDALDMTAMDAVEVPEVSAGGGSIWMGFLIIIVGIALFNAL